MICFAKETLDCTIRTEPTVTDQHDLFKYRLGVLIYFDI